MDEQTGVNKEKKNDNLKTLSFGMANWHDTEIDLTHPYNYFLHLHVITHSHRSETINYPQAVTIDK